MESKEFRKLRIDPEFKSLIRPLRKEEYTQLEANLKSDGCREPLITWDGCIIDGHNRYEICNRLHIPYAVHEMHFDSRAQAITWICANQLGRRNISEETRKYLIGKQYESEKIVITQRNAKGRNQYPLIIPDFSNPDRGPETPRQPETKNRTADRIGAENNISHGTVEKYHIYSRALDVIGSKDPSIVPKILSGVYKISHKNLVALSKLEPAEIKRINKRMGEHQNPFIQYSKSRQEIKRRPNKAPRDELAAGPSVKDLPAFDPDAELTGLALTIPSWTSSLQRAKEKTKFSMVSVTAKANLEKVLITHIETGAEILDIIKED
jgi:hypothetical protein